MIRTFAEVDRRAATVGKKKLAVLAPEDEEFLHAIRTGRQKGWIEPVLIGNRDSIRRAADRIGFAMDGAEIIHKLDRQAISDLGTSMLFAGQVDLISKGQIPTAFIYRSIIREEGKSGTGRNVSVISLWDVPGLNHLTSLTDTGVNIRPDFSAKVKILKNAVFLFHLLGYERPRIAILSAPRIGESLHDPLEDYEKLVKECRRGGLGDCEIIPGTRFSEFLPDKHDTVSRGEDVRFENFPEVLLVPHLDTGNILVKLDFFLEVKRRSLVITTKGPVIIPSRSDFRESILGELALGMVAAENLRKRS